mmetsp:Transcript_33651/g.38705  ORF Transcript_33651/g.38705 Transcript_33651/m.38705 type:complete len:271 (+) Transcript_33651:397-1209(+)
MSFFTQREVFLKAAEEGKDIQYVDDDEPASQVHAQPVPTPILLAGVGDPVGDAQPQAARPQPPEPAADGKGSKAEPEEDKQAARAKKEYTVGGLKCAKSPLAGPESLRVTVGDPTVHDDGFFSSKYVTFQVKTEQLELDVRRKDRDFGCLSEYFCKVCPYVLIPSLPELKKSAKFDPEYLARRAAQLEAFLNKCLQCDELRLFPVFYEFLKQPDYKAYSKQLKSSSEKAVKAVSTRDFYSPSGLHTINANKHIISFSDNLNVYLSVYETC